MPTITILSIFCVNVHVNERFLITKFLYSYISVPQVHDNKFLFGIRDTMRPVLIMRIFFFLNDRQNYKILPVWKVLRPLDI